MGVCPQGQGERLVKHGAAAGKPKKRCQQCGYQCTRTTPRGTPLATKSHAVLGYVSGMAMPRLAFLLRVSPPAVLPWIRDLATASYEQPEPTGRTSVLQRDEMWPYLTHKRGKLSIGQALDWDTGPLLDWAWGRRAKRTLQKRVDRLAPWDITRSCTAKWAT
jgi:transposase-like protein